MDNKSILNEERRVHQEIMLDIINDASDDYSVLSKILNLALFVCPEADYGSVTIIDEDSWRFIDSVGHDADRLKGLTMKFTKYDREIGDDIFIVENILDLQQEVRVGEDLDNYVELIKASKPIKSTIEVIARNGNQFLGQLTLDIAEGSDKEFTQETVEKLKLYRDTLRLALMHKENRTIIDRYDHAIKVFNEHTYDFKYHVDKFIDEYLEILRKEVHEAELGTFAIFRDENIEYSRIEGLDETVVAMLPSKKADFLEQLLSDNHHEIYDGVYLYRGEENEHPSFIHGNKNLESRDALVALLENNDEHLGFIYLGISELSMSSFSRKSKKLFNLMSKLASTYMALYRNNVVIDNFEMISSLTNRLMSSVLKQDDSILGDVLNTAIKIIPEASYGNISILEDGKWIFKYTVGHDLEAINKLGLKDQHCIKVDAISNGETEENSGIVLVSDYDKYRDEDIPEDIYVKFNEATKPMGTAALMQYKQDGEYIGNFSVEIDENDEQIFSQNSLSILSALSNIVFVYFGFSKYIANQEKSRKEFEQLNAKLEERVLLRTEELKEANLKLQELVAIDGLTGLYNRRSFDTFISERWKSAVRHKDDLAIVMIDIDYFKSYNDFYGHIKGDACLKIFSGLLSDHFRRADDYVARYGGEEFVVAISQTDHLEVVQHLERLLNKVRDTLIVHEISPKGFITFSAGIAFIKPEDTKFEDCIRRSDQALYEAKHNGKDQISVYK